MRDAAMWAWGPAGHAHVSIMSGQAPTLSRVEQRLARFLILAHWQQLDRSFTFVYSPFDPLPFSICYICTRKAGTDRVVSEDCDSCWLVRIVVMQCLQSPVAHHSVLERQRFSSRWKQQGQEQPSHHSYSAAGLCVQGLNPFDCFSNGLPNLPQYSLAAPPNFEETSVAVSDSSFRKRKAETSPKSKQDLGKVESNCKRMKRETGGGGGGAKSESKQQNSRKEASGDSSKKDEETPKTDYIHVRARRGQATDSHSLAERVRRERISQRMKYLQELVPGCSKITGKAGMLDEIINYVQSLQRQVEFLSMKLAAVNPTADINFSSGEAMTQLVHINPPSRSSSMGISSELMDQPFLHFNSLQLHPCSGLDMYMDSSDIVPDGSSFGSCSTLNSLYRVEFQLGRGTAAFPFQSLQGNLLPNNLKMEI